MKSVLVAALVVVAVPAWAGESLIAGQPLEYNHAYRCKGERIIVARCRDNDDGSYCQIVYPDRPFVNGNQVAPVEMRGDVVAKLNACSQVASTPQRQPVDPPRSNNAGAAPGVGEASWWVMDYSDKEAIFFTKEGIKRSAGSGQGWFTAVYSKPQDVSATIKDAQYLQILFTADCTKGTFVDRAGAYLDEDGNLIHASALNDPPARPERGTFADAQLNIVCGKPQKLREPAPLNGDGQVLIYYYQSELHATKD